MLFIASDHRGFDLKQKLLLKLTKGGVDVEDVGTYDKQRSDYPVFAKALCEKVLTSPENKGILICHTGIGMSIAANKIKGIRAGLCNNKRVCELARSDDDINVLVLPAKNQCVFKSERIVKAFLSTNFKGGHYKTRIDMIE